MGRADGRIRQAAASDRRLDDQLLLLNQTLRRDQGLLIRCNLSLRPRHFDRRLLALLNLVLVVLIQPLGQPQCFALHLDVFIQTHQVRIEPGDAGHRVDHLLSKHQIGDPSVVLGDANESAIQLDSEAAQQRLGNGKSQA